MAGPRGTADRVLDVAERLVQSQGFNGFSYADIAGELGITKASLHYHFPTKAALGASLIARYAVSFGRALGEIDGAETSAAGKLRRYAALYEAVLRKGRMCLCGMLAADYSTLPREMRDGVKSFFDHNEAWLAGVLEDGRGARELAFRGAPVEQARLLLAALEGSMLVARTYGDAARFVASAAQLLEALAQPSGPKRRLPGAAASSLVKNSR
jgi:TetR/AcrR family transcriptional repressor of nem operon